MTLNFKGDKIEIPLNFLYDVEGSNILSWNDRKVYLFILAYKNMHGKNPSRPEIDMNCGISYALSNRALKKLRSLGLLDVKRRFRKSGKGNLPHEYTLKAW